jgi:hypothetical protein
MSAVYGRKILCCIRYLNSDYVNDQTHRSTFISGDLWQLPPIYDQMVTDNNNLDGRPDCAPSHWKEHFRIFYLTEKMRSQKDPFFSDLCDRVGRGNITANDEKYLNSRVQPNSSEKEKENFKNGKLSIIVTTNSKKDLINHQKLSQLLPNGKALIE